MFTWICPKCGKEVPPAYSECPNCAATETQAPATPERAEAAGPVEPAAPPPASARAPRAAAKSSSGVHVPGWLMSIVFAAVFIIIGLTLVIIFRSREPDQAGAAPSTQAAAPLNSPAQASPAAVQAEPVLRDVELTGLRITEDNKQKPFVQFVVVNHSRADLGTISARVNLRAVAKEDQAPVGTFAFKAALGPLESKDLKAPLETKLRAYELPDWQFLRAEITGK